MPSGDKKKRKNSSGEESELDSALDQVGDESAAAAINEFRDLLTQAKGDTTELVRQNANELEQRLILLKQGKLDKEDFDYFVENQKRDLRVFIDSQPAQVQERAENLTLHVLDIAATIAAVLKCVVPHFTRSALGVRGVFALLSDWGANSTKRRENACALRKLHE